MRQIIHTEKQMNCEEEEVPSEFDGDRDQIEKMFRLAAAFGWKPNFHKADLTRLMLNIFEYEEHRHTIRHLYEERQHDLIALGKAIQKSCSRLGSRVVVGSITQGVTDFWRS